MDGTTAEPQAPPPELGQKIEALVERYRASRCEDVDALIQLTDLLPDSDGVPLESPWHSAAIALLKEVLSWHWRDRDDFFVGGNMFVYYRLDRLLHQEFRGPDFFYVSGAERRKHRDKWSVWMEDGKYPDLVIEFLSPSTAKIDRTTKKDLYATIWRVSEYFCYDPDLGELEGWRLDLSKGYQPIASDERGWMWSEQLGMWLGRWSGEFQGIGATWLRFYDVQGQLALLAAEAANLRAEAERERADREHQRAEIAAGELARALARLAELEQKLREQEPPPAPPPDQGGGETHPE